MLHWTPFNLLCGSVCRGEAVNRTDDTVTVSLLPFLIFSCNNSVEQQLCLFLPRQKEEKKDNSVTTENLGIFLKCLLQKKKLRIYKERRETEMKLD